MDDGLIALLVILLIGGAIGFHYGWKFATKRQEKRATAYQGELASKEMQAILDDSYTFKVKTLLSGITLKNHEKRLDQIKKEEARYLELVGNYGHLNIVNNSDWESVKRKYIEAVVMLQRAQDEKEAQNEIKRQIKEEKARQDELERRQEEARKQEEQLEIQRKAIEEALKNATEEHKTELERQRKALEQEIEETHKKYERAKSMAQLTKQGHVYVISNVGSFGENVFKVGMTRRLEPLDRIKELGDASVPFNFDVHAMINCDDAPALEKALHEDLSKYQMNKVNPRKEFFKTDIGTIINKVEDNFGKVEYVADAPALQYLQTLEIESGR